MSPADFETAWRRWYPDAPPVGHELRVAYSTRWARVHSLPGSKRYPDDAAEWAEVLRRMNEVAAFVLGEGTAIAIVRPDWDDDAGVALATWRAGVFDAVLRRVAEDESRAVFVALDSGAVFAPYDGGADVFVSDPERFCARFRRWLSPRRDGL